jgi:hypothetical protein
MHSCIAKKRPANIRRRVAIITDYYEPLALCLFGMTAMAAKAETVAQALARLIG